MGAGRGLGRALGSEAAMKRGDIFWCNLPPPDGRRPALLLTRTRAHGFLESLTVAPLTTTLRVTPSFVLLTLDDGLFADSAVNCDRLMTVAKSVVAEYVTTLSDVRMALVEQAIRFALDFAD